MLVLPPVLPPARPRRGAPVGGLGLLGGPQVVEVSTVRASADGPVQAHGALAGLLGLALARPHVHGPGRGRGQKEEGVILDSYGLTHWLLSLNEHACSYG